MRALRLCRSHLGPLVLFAALALGAAPAAAANAGDATRDARRIYQEATAAFGLGRYAEAAEKYEAAFTLRPDPALLYNAAQSYRLAGKKARALELYQNYGRLYGDTAKAADARNHTAALRKAIEEEQRLATTPPPAALGGSPAARPASSPPPAVAPIAPGPAAPASASVSPPAPVPAAAPPEAGTSLAASASVPTVTATAAPPEPRGSIFRSPWLWGAVGFVVAAGVFGALLGTGGDKYPEPTLGTVTGN